MSFFVSFVSNTHTHTHIYKQSVEYWNIAISTSWTPSFWAIKRLIWKCLFAPDNASDPLDWQISFFPNIYQTRKTNGHVTCCLSKTRYLQRQNLPTQHLNNKNDRNDGNKKQAKTAFEKNIIKQQRFYRKKVAVKIKIKYSIALLRNINSILCVCVCFFFVEWFAESFQLKMLEALVQSLPNWRSGYGQSVLLWIQREPSDA